MQNSKYLKLKIGFFNINGLVGETSFNPDFLEIIKKSIITLSETWHKNPDCINKIKGNFPKEYRFVDNARKNKHKKVREILGGSWYATKNVYTAALSYSTKNLKT